MTFKDLTAADAETYRARVAADGPSRLRELSQHLTVAGVSLAPFDATIPSLEPLWRWYTDFTLRDFPGIPADAEPRTEAVEPQGREIARAGYASELLAHYMFEVAKRCFSDVAWVCNSYRGTDSFQRTAAQYQDDSGFVGLAHLDRFTRGVTLKLRMEDGAEIAAPGFLAERFLVGPFLCGTTTAARCRTIPRGTSILTGPWSDTEGDGGELAFAQVAPEVHLLLDESEEGGELLFAHMAADVESLEEAPSLDLAEVIPVLAGLGFLDLAGVAPTAQGILGESFADFARGDDATVTTLVAGGALRALQIASVSPSAAAWNEITGALAQLAPRLDARLAPEDEFN